MHIDLLLTADMLTAEILQKGLLITEISQTF